MDSPAIKSLCALERRYRVEAVAAPVQERQERELWVGTCVSVAGVPLLIGEGELAEIIETPKTMVIPGTKPWVLGVGSHVGGPIPIISGDAFFRRRPYTGRPREYAMVLRRPGLYCGITLSGLERDMKFPVEQRDMDAGVDPDFAAYAAGGFADAERVLAVLDINKLVADSEFSNAAANEAITHEVVKDD